MHNRQLIDMRLTRHAGIGLVAAVGLMIHGWIVLAPSAVMGFTDALDYLLLADHFFGWLRLEGGADASTAQHFEASRYPPLYPALLGAFGGGTGNQHVAMIVSNSVAIFAGMSVWFWASKAFGRAAATFIAVSLLLYPMHFVLNLHTVAESLSLAVVACSLTLLTTQPARPRLIYLGVALAALAPLVKAASLPILPAMAIALFANSTLPRWRIALLLGIAAMPSALWFIARPLTGAESYTAALDPQFMLLKMGGWPDALWLQPWRLFTALVANWGTPGSSLAFLLGVVVVTLGGVGCFDRARQGLADAWFLMGYLCLLVVWPYPAEFQRLLVPIYPFVLGCTVHALRLGARWVPGNNASWPWHRSLIVFATLLLLVQAPAIARYAMRAGMPVDSELVTDKRRAEFFTAADDAEALRRIEKYARVRSLASATRAAIPKGGCIYAADPRLLMVYAGVRAISYPPGIEHTEEARRVLTTCDFFFISGFGMGDLGLPPEYPARQLIEWTEPVLLSNGTVDGANVLSAALLVRK